MLIIGGVIFIGYLYFVGFWQVVQVILALDVRIALSTIVIDLSCIVLFSLGWKLLLGSGMKFKYCIEGVLVSIFGDMMIPTASISGEIFRISLAVKKSKLQISEVTASVFLHRLILGLTFGAVLGFSVIMLILTETMQMATLSFFIGMVAIDIVLAIIGIYAVFNTHKFKKLASKIILKTGGFFRRFKSSYNAEEMKNKVIGGFDTFHGAVVGVKKEKMLASIAILTVRWFIVALVPYLMFYSLGYHASYWIVLTVSIMVSMVQMVPIGIPGLVGVMEVSMTAFFIGFGIAADIAASATILTRLVMFWFELFISAIATSYIGVKEAMTSGKNNALGD
jgi:uncharacterized protein (TIRG00374 family)